MAFDKTQILKNFDEAIKAVEEFSEDRIDLSSYTSAEKPADILDCGTLFCLAGLIAVTPYFVARGWSFGLDYEDELDVQINNEPFVTYVAGACTDLCDFDFGHDSWGNLFTVRHGSYFDEVFLENCPTATDKDLALNRLRMRRAELENDLK